LIFLSYNIDTDCPSRNTILTFRLETSFVFKKTNSEDTTMPLRVEINACVEESLRPFFFIIKIVQIWNYPWVSTKTRPHVRVFLLFLYGRQTQAHESKVVARPRRMGLATTSDTHYLSLPNMSDARYLSLKTISDPQALGLTTILNPGVLGLMWLPNPDALSATWLR